MDIKAIIFDLGEVVFRCSFDHTFDIWAKETGRTAAALKEQFVFNEVFEAFERSDISPDEFMAEVSGQLGQSFDRDSFTRGWNAIYMDAVPGIAALLMQLKQHYRLVALTNTNTVHATVWTKKYNDLFVYFERIFSSHEIKMRKPETRAFQLVLDHLQLPATQTLFLDDKEEYLAGARALGIHTIQVLSAEQMIADLEHAGIRIA